MDKLQLSSLDTWGVLLKHEDMHTKLPRKDTQKGREQPPHPLLSV